MATNVEDNLHLEVYGETEVKDEALDYDEVKGVCNEAKKERPNPLLLLLRRWWIAIVVIVAVALLFGLAVHLGTSYTFLRKVSDKMNDLDNKLSDMMTNMNTKLSDKISDLDYKMLKKLEGLDDKLTYKISELDKKLSDTNSDLVEVLQRFHPILVCLDTNVNTTAIVDHPNGLNNMIRCDNSIPGGPWLVIQRRVDGTTEFYRGWDEYVSGFGDLRTNFWLGLENIYELSKGGVELRVDLWYNGTYEYAEYRNFRLGDASTNYTLQISGYNGTAGDSILTGNSSNHYNLNGFAFSTYDKDNDDYDYNCAEYHQGAWWYRFCSNSNLNGVYDYGEEYFKGPYWRTFSDTGHSIAMDRVEMKIRA